MALETSRGVVVLYVDPDRDVRERVRRGLADTYPGATVVTADTVRAAREYASDHAVDCVVTVESLDDGDGIELLSTLAGANPDVSSVLVANGGAERARSPPDPVDHVVETVAAVDAAVGTATRLGDGRDAKAQLAAIDRYRRDLYRITTETEFDAREKVRRILELGCSVLDVDNGVVSRIDPDTDRYVVDVDVGGDAFPTGFETDLSTTYCRNVVTSDEVLGIYDAEATGYGDDPAHEHHGIASYLGAKLLVDDELYGTVCFVDEEPRERPFTAAERSFVDMASKWIGHAFERREYVEQLRPKDRAMAVAPIGITIADATAPDEPLVYANEAFEQLTGYDAEEILGENCRFLQGEQTAEEPVAAMRSAIEAEEPVTVELRNYRKDGSEFWNRVSIAPVRDETGTVTHFVGFQEDVTERKERSQKLEAIVENTTNPIFIKDAAGRYLFVNAAAANAAGLDPDELVGMTDAEVFDDETLEAIRQGDERVLEEGENVTEEVITVVDGEPRVYLDDKYPYRNEDGEVVGVMGISRDVTELKEREATLEALTERLDSVVSNVPIILFAMDPDGTFTLSEGKGLEKLGLEPGEVVGESVFDVYADHEGILSDAEHALQGERVESVRELGGLHFDTTYQPVFDDDGNLVESIGVAVDVTERENREEELKRYETIIQAIADPVYTIDDEGTILFGNEAIETVTGYPAADLVGEHISKLMTEEDLDHAQDLIRELLRTDEDYATFEMDLLTADGDAIATENHMALLPMEDGEFRGTAGVARDVTDRKRREEQLEHLNEISRELGGAESREAICEVACRQTSEKLNLPMCALHLYDEDAGTLTPEYRTPAVNDLTGGEPLFDPDDDALWQAYFENEELVFEDVDDGPEANADLRSAAFVPLGKHGVFTVASAGPDPLTEIELDLARLLVGHVEVALQRVDREQALREQTERLESQKEQLEGLDRINRVIRDITRALVQATTREDVEETVCANLAQGDPYRLAWIGRHETVGGQIVPRVAAGEDREAVDAVTPSIDDDVDGTDLLDEAVETGRPQVENDLRTDPPVAAWRAAALRRGFRSMIVVPITFRKTRYGVLCLYADRPGAFDEEEASVLGELGEMMGYAINAIDSKKALVGDTAVQLEFSVDDPDIPAAWGLTEPGQVLELKSIVRRADDALRLFFTISGGDPEEMIRTVEQGTAVTDVQLITRRNGELLFESTLTESSFLRRLLEYGAHPVSMTVSPEQSSVTVELPQSADVSAFIDTFLTSYENADLVARRELDRPIRTREGFEQTYKDRLTDRQLEVLETAYHSGFFEWPRESTGEDVADMLGVSQPTVNRHIREGSRRLFELVFEDGTDD